MMFLHLVRSFGSKTVKLPHVLTFFWRADLCAACSFRTALQKMHCKKMHEVRVEQKRAQETKTMLVARWEDDLDHCSLHRQRRAERKFETRMRCMSEVFTKTSCWWLNQSQQQKKPVSAINLRFSTCLWQTYRAIIQTIYTGMVTLRLMCKQCWTGKNQSRPVAVPWLAVRPGSKSSKID
jgi:hypothetical protein